MTSDKRDMADFTIFPGGIDDKSHTYIFHKLTKKDSKGKIRYWQAFIRLVRDGARQTVNDWDLSLEKVFPLKDNYFYTNDHYCALPKNCVAEMWAEHGIIDGKRVRNVPSYYDGVKNEGKSNQRHALHSAMIDARSQYLKKEKAGSRAAVDNTTADSNDDAVATAVSQRYYPMLAEKYDDHKEKITWPAFVQPKLDGLRCLAYYDVEKKEVDMYSRSLHDFNGKEHIRAILRRVLKLKAFAGVYVDGEFYRHGKRLQDISGIARRDNNDAELQYHIYDCFKPSDLSLSYIERRKILDNFFAKLSDDEKNIICEVPTHVVHAHEEIKSIFDRLVTEKYEGCIVRGPNSPYLTNNTGTSQALRSKFLLKYKDKSTAEFKVVDFTQGAKGKAVGRIIWICSTEQGDRFNVTMKDMDDAQQKALYSECLAAGVFVGKYKGRNLTVEFDSLSKTGVPQRAKGVIFRDD
jgi:ATP-dependent DNA ligase